MPAEFPEQVNLIADKQRPLTEIDRVLRSGLSRRGFLAWTARGAVIAGVLPVLAACGGDDDDDDSGAATATTGGTEATATTGGGTEATATTGSGGTDATATTGGAAEPTATTGGGSGDLGSGGQLINGRSGDSDSLDPQRTIASASWFVFSNIFDSLVAKNMALEFDPCIAEKYEISDDGLTYTWTIRDGIPFHDGSTLTVEDVKFTFDRATDETAPSQASGFISAYESSEIVDDKTVVFTLSEPSAPFLSNIEVAYFGILPKAAVEAAGDDFGTNPVGSGPFVFDEWIQGEQITLVPFADYTNYRTYVQNTGAPLAESLTFRVILEANTLLSAFDTGEINQITLPSQEVADYQDKDGYEVILATGGTNIIYLEFATTPLPEGTETGDPVFNAPFDDLKVRQAFAYATDADEIIESVLAGLGYRNYGLMPTGLFAYDPAINEFGYGFDLDKANALLDEAGWTMNSDGVREKDGQTMELEFWAWTDPTYEKVVQVVQNQVAKAGFKLNLSVLEVGTMLAQLPEGTNNANIMGVGWPEADIMWIMASDIGWGMGNYRPTEYIELLQQARTTSDQAERKEFYFEAQKIALADCACVPLWTDLDAIVGIRSEVKNLKLGPDSIIVWVDAWVES